MDQDGIDTVAEFLERMMVNRATTLLLAEIGVHRDTSVVMRLLGRLPDAMEYAKYEKAAAGRITRGERRPVNVRNTANMTTS